MVQGRRQTENRPLFHRNCEQRVLHSSPVDKVTRCLVTGQPVVGKGGLSNMRFSRTFIQVFEDTRRKRLAYMRKLAAECQRYPLFSDQIASEQLGVDAEMSARRVYQEVRATESRLRRARKWRLVRARFFALPHTERTALAKFWRRCSWPGDPEYFACMITAFARGDLILDPEYPEQTESQRHAARRCIERILLARSQSHQCSAALSERHPLVVQ